MEDIVIKQLNISIGNAASQESAARQIAQVEAQGYIHYQTLSLGFNEIICFFRRVK